MGGLRALDISEERALAGRLAGALYLIGALTGALLLVLPGVEVSDPGLLIGVCAAGGAWGVAALTVVPWKHAHPLVSHLSSGAGLPITAVAMALSGGAGSPARFYLFFIVVYCSYFYPRREALPHLLGCVAAVLLPLAYDGDAVAAGALGELVIVVPTFVVLGLLIMAGKAVLVELREEARQLSLHDALTGLWNRRAFVDRLAERVGGQRSSDTVGLLLVDLDGFKDVNTLYGHPAGDRVLCETAAVLESSVRDDDLVARLGGDEFAILVHEAGEASVVMLAERILAALRETDWRLDLPDYRLRASVGWALAPEHATTGEDLVRAADDALREAKAEGKDRWEASRGFEPEAVA